jgi:DNA ligase-1
MRDLAKLFENLDRTTKTLKKVVALNNYFQNKKVSDHDKLWAAWFLSGERLPQPVNRTLLKEWSAELAAVPDWLFAESYNQIADLAETITLILPEPNKKYRNRRLGKWAVELIDLKNKSVVEKKAYVLKVWASLPRLERFVFNKLITGAFRVGASKKLVYRSIAQTYELPEDEVQFRLGGKWTPAEFESLEEILFSDQANTARPYPFALAYQLDRDFAELGHPDEWQAEWKWDGIRSQIIKRSGEVHIWSRGEDLITDQFPDLAEIATGLPDGTAIDGELIVIENGKIQPFNSLQNRLGRKNVSGAMMKKNPVGIIAYDIFEYDSNDVRNQSLTKRRKLLEEAVSIVNHNNLILSQEISFNSWDQLSKIKDTARDMDAEGVMIKHRGSEYFVGRKKGKWWKWKVDPYTLDMVLMYAQRGSGRRATLYTDYTLGVWDTSTGPIPDTIDGFPQPGQAQLVPLAKAYSGLTDKEIAKVDNWIKKNTFERFGPVRTVKVGQVFEIAFEGIAPSARHKSGLAVRFPRILRWRQDKPVSEADTLEAANSLLRSK